MKKQIITLVALIIVNCQLIIDNCSAQCPGIATGPNNGTTTNIATGFQPWTTPGNAATSNNAYAEVTLGGPINATTSEDLRAVGFGFAIISTNTICGIVVQIERKAAFVNNPVRDLTVRLTKNGTAMVGLNRAKTTTDWPAADAYTTYGSNSDLWGTTWTPAQINSATFGVFINATLVENIASEPSTAQIDHVRITVYTAAALPVELLYFNAYPDNESIVRCEWSTASELNNDYFAIERSKDGVDFFNIGTRQGAGNSSVTLNYIFYDYEPYTGISYYRLKQVDYGGQYSYSPIHQVYIGALDIVSIYPNPSTDYIQYLLASEEGGAVTVKLLDALGREVLRYEEPIDAGITTKKISTAALSSGTYLLKITSGKQEQTQKQFVVK